MNEEETMWEMIYGVLYSPYKMIWVKSTTLGKCTITIPIMIVLYIMMPFAVIFLSLIIFTIKLCEKYPILNQPMGKFFFKEK